MGKMIAYCGIVCSECPTLLATQKDDDEARKQDVEMWSKQFKFDLKMEDINCDGCLTDRDRLFENIGVFAQTEPRNHNNHE